MSKFTKIHPFGAQFFRAGLQTDGQASTIANSRFSQTANTSKMYSCAKMTVLYPLRSATTLPFGWKSCGFCSAHLDWENVWREKCLLCRVNMGKLNMGTVVATVHGTEGPKCCGLGKIVQPCFASLWRYKQNVIIINIHFVENNRGVGQLSGQNWEQFANCVSKLAGIFVRTHVVEAYAYLSTYLITYLLTYPFTYQPTYLPNYLPTHPPTHPPTYPPTNLSTYLIYSFLYIV